MTLGVQLAYCQVERLSHTMSSNTNTQKQIVLITGGNQGIGFEIVKKLVSEYPEYHILVGCRDLLKGQEALSKLSDFKDRLSAVQVDITSADSIGACTSQIKHDFGKLDVLINNAGIGAAAVQRIPQIAEQMEHIFKTNVFGTAAMTDACLPLLQQAADMGSTPRIVFISSEMGSVMNTLDPEWKYYGPNRSIPYKSSKAAENMVGACYSVRFKDAGWKINCCCPGFRKTGFNNYLEFAMNVEEGAVNAVRLATLGPDGPTGTFSDIDGVLPW